MTRPYTWRERLTGFRGSPLALARRETRAYSAWRDKRNCGVLGPSLPSTKHTTAMSSSLMMMFVGALAKAEQQGAQREGKEEGHAVFPIRSCIHELVAWTQLAWYLCHSGVGERSEFGSKGDAEGSQFALLLPHIPPPLPRSTRAATSSNACGCAALKPFVPCIRFSEGAISFLTFANSPLPRQMPTAT